MTEVQLGQLKAITDSLAMEVVFAEEGKDNGLLPINSLLGQFDQMLSAATVAGPLIEATRAARSWLDEIFDTTGLFSGPVIGRLNVWVQWLQSAMQSLEDGSAFPDLPATWDRAQPGAASSPSRDATAASSPIATTEAASPAVTEPVLNLNAEADGDLLREFINESGEHLQNIEQGVLVLEDNPTDANTLNAIFRAFHTFKGGSGFLNLIPIQTLAHELESLLDQARQHRLEITPDVIDLILEGGDTLRQFLGEIDRQVSGQSPPSPIVVPTLKLLARIRAVLQGQSTPSAVRHESECADSTAPAGETSAPETAAPAAAAKTDANDGAKASGPASAVKVDTLKLDSLVDMIGELVIAQSLVVQNRALASVADQQLSRDLAQLGRITKDLQRIAMSLRMVPIRGTFQKMNRLVRDTAAKVGKQVELVLEGEETELDRTLVEVISDPLIHMIRNSIDHGIERPEVRQECGKPARGTVWLTAYYQGGNIVIEIKDDGRGLDRERIRAKAIEKGLIGADEALNESEIFNLIHAPGFSTADKVTDLSGRGVGLDVVKRNIEKLRGKVEVQSTPGQGSTFSIHLPLTLAIIDGLIVGVGDERFILPTLSVCESFRPTPQMISTVHGRGEMMNVRGQLRPVLRLYNHFGITPASTDPTQSIAVVVESGRNTRCVVVDQLLGKQEVVIKSLGETFKQNHALAGAAILGDGRVGLILDPQALVQIDRGHDSAASEVKSP